MVVIRLCLDVGLQGNGKGESENWAGLGWAGLNPSIGSTGSFLPVEDVSPTSINVLNSTYNETVSCLGCVYGVRKAALWEEATLVLLKPRSRCMSTR